MRMVHFHRQRPKDDGSYSGDALLWINPKHIIAIEDNGETDTCDIIVTGPIVYRVMAPFQHVQEILFRYDD